MREDEDDSAFIDAAVRAAEDALIESERRRRARLHADRARHPRDARPARRQPRLRASRCIGLFGRMPAARAAAHLRAGPQAARRSSRRTSPRLRSRIPRIRYVIDTGLARISRYNPRTRTKRLPVEDVSQSSANQRAGRAGRVQDGICIRLYAQEDFEKRPRFTQPEIQRANLAEVILRMKAFRLGEIETFPFLNPPRRRRDPRRLHAAARTRRAQRHATN